MMWTLTAAVGTTNPGTYVYDSDTSEWLLKAVSNLDDITDGELYGRSLSSRSNEYMMRTDFIKYNGESLDGVNVFEFVNGTVTDGVGYLLFAVDGTDTGAATITCPQTTFNMDIIEKPLALKARVSWDDNDGSDGITSFLIIADAVQTDYFGYYVTNGDGYINRVVNSSGVLTTSHVIRYVNGYPYKLETYYDPSTGIVWRRDGERSTVWDKDSNPMPDINNVNPFWIRLQSDDVKLSKNMKLFYVASSLQWDEEN
jgi:hypothetical protein